MPTEDKELKVSFMSKKEYECPSCKATFHKEELLSGGGRLIAGGLTEELHRLYDPSIKYGDVYPLVYHALVCPECWFASSEADFPLLPEGSLDRVAGDEQTRKAETLLAFPGIDFSKPRGPMEGAASFYLVMRCYDFFDKEHSPTVKQGLAAIRAAWMLDELSKKYPHQHYDWLAVLFRKKAQYFYSEALTREEKRIETMSAMKAFGPDTDRNYGYEGMLYLCAYLQYKYGPSQTPADRKATLEIARRTIAKLFGLGKSSKDKPSAFLDLARKVYDDINRELTIND